MTSQPAFKRARTAGSIETLFPLVLVPYDVSEAMSTRDAAKAAGKSEATIRSWCETRGIGRRIVGAWAVSRVALQMLLDGDDIALNLYQGGERQDEAVARYYRELGLVSLLYSAQFQQSQ